MKKSIVIAICLLATFSLSAKEYVFSLNECIQFSLKNSSELKSQKGSLKAAEGLHDWAKGLAYPKLQLFSFLTMDGERTGNAILSERNWTLSRWGPYYNLNATLLQPLFTWGTISGAKEATRNLRLVERERYREKKMKLIQEIKTYYYGHLYVKRIHQVLNFGFKNLNGALEYARKEFAKSSGKITRPDLSRLELGMLELKKFRLEADKMGKLAMDALKVKLGLPRNATIKTREKYLALDMTKIKPLAEYVKIAYKYYPMWRQLKYGIKARNAQVKAVKGQALPIFYVGAIFNFAWSPQSDKQDNSFLNDPYNKLDFGAAVGFQWSLDFWSTKGKIKQAEGERDKLVKLKPFARDGLKVQVKQAYLDLIQKKKLLANLRLAVKIARKWMIFGLAGYQLGTTKSKDVLEGLTSFLLKRKEYYEALMNYNLALGKLGLVTGKELSKNLVY